MANCPVVFLNDNMISVIICSVNKDFANQVKSNIEDTIGVQWETIIIDNTINPAPITKVYNAGAAKAKYDTLCFVHEDVLFKTQNWGLKILEYFNQNKKLGLIGVGGSKYKSKTPSGWFCGLPKLDCCSISHLDRAGNKELLLMNPDQGKRIQQVVTVDGVFMCCPKNVWLETKFNEVLLTDFHLYDIDFSIRVSEKYESAVTFEIDILHIVKGNHYGDKWLESTLLWHKHFNKRLPLSFGLHTKEKKVESQIVSTWLIRLKHEEISFKNKLKWLLAIKFWKYIRSWRYIPFFLLKSYLKKSKILD